MIWVGGAIVPDDALKVSVLDRTFEHGLGLFETFRTWNGHATLLDRHLARMGRSAEELRLPLDPKALPDAKAVAALLEADGRSGDAMLRITMSGGLSETEGGMVWMRSFTLPPPWDDGRGLFVSTTPGWERRDDAHSKLARHKTLNYWPRRLRSSGDDEILLVAEDGGPIEGDRTNVFYFLGHTLKTPDLEFPILPGIMRGATIEAARSLGIAVEPASQGAEWAQADEMFLTNSVRGILPVASVDGTVFFDSPGRRTLALWDHLKARLERGEIEPR